MSDHSEHEQENNPELSSIQMKAIMGEMTRLLRVEMESVHTRLDRIQEDTQTRQPTGGDTGRSRTNQRRSTNHEERESDHNSSGSRGRNRRPRQDNYLGSLKLKIPPFHGKNDPDAYLEWEKKIELVFDCQNYSEIKKVRLAATEFHGYAINWWDQIVTSRRRSGEPAVDTWEEMTNLLRKRFVPSHYHRDLHQRLRRLVQGTKSVEDYCQEMETLMIKVDAVEDPEATMARFQGGLNREIQDRLEMHEYDCLEEMLHKAILVEQQVKRRSFPKSAYNPSAKSSYQDKGKALTKSSSDFKTNQSSSVVKGKAEEPTTTRSRDMRCFKCQGLGHFAKECTNKKVMIVLENGEIESEDEMPQSDSEEEHVDYP